ncbi:MAG: glycosyltransferase [Steroidobacteraceae bacterium]
MYARLLQGRPHEVIVIPDARGMCEGYGRGMKSARGEVVVFAHHDLEYLFDDFAAVLDRAMAQFDVIGVAGTDELIHPIWTAAGIGRLFGQIVHPGIQAGFEVTVYGAPRPMIGGIRAMDGLFLAAGREVVERIGWDAELFDGWHFYDIDFTYRAACAGYRLGIISELGFLHQSRGEASADYATYARRFAAKHMATIPSRPLHPMQVATQQVLTLDEARAVIRPAFWRR